MNVLQLKKRLRIFTDLKFAIVILLTIAIASSLGSFIEQDENIEFYQENYPLNKPIYGFITWKTIIILGLDIKPLPIHNICNSPPDKVAAN